MRAAMRQSFTNDKMLVRFDRSSRTRMRNARAASSEFHPRFLSAKSPATAKDYGVRRRGLQSLVSARRHRFQGPFGAPVSERQKSRSKLEEGGSAGGHRTGIRVGKRYLLIWRVAHLRVKHFQAAHLLLQPSDLFLDPRRLDDGCFRRLLPIGTIELTQISTDAFLDLRHPPRHLGICEVAVAVVHRLELAAVNRDARGLQQAHLPA